ncbi:DOMON domain containing protein [Plasmodiophora brassicae]
MRSVEVLSMLSYRVWAVAVALSAAGAYGAIDLPAPGPQAVKGSVTVTGHWRCAWKTDAANNLIELEVTLLEPGERGWVAVGLTKTSPTSGHLMTDSLIGWVDDAGAAHVYDQFSKAYAQPDLDVNVGGQDNVALVSGQVNADKTTTIIMRRRLVTGDTATDIDIVNGTTTNMLWAHGIDVPVVNQGPPLTLSYGKHEDDDQGIFQVNLFAAGDTTLTPGQTGDDGKDGAGGPDNTPGAMKSNAFASPSTIATTVAVALVGTVAVL